VSGAGFLIGRRLISTYLHKKIGNFLIGKLPLLGTPAIGWKIINLFSRKIYGFWS
tara:strand:+ start:336 stop:500 length:165 start_codon:yes stop_codon:yes gene_type:complete